MSRPPALFLILGVAACHGGGAAGDAGGGGDGGAIDARADGSGGNGGGGGTVGGDASGGGSGDASTSDGPAGEAGPGPDGGVPALGCPALAAPTGATMTVTSAMADNLAALVGSAASGTTVLLADGVYKQAGTAIIQMSKPNVTLRSASNDATKVVIDGDYRTNEIIQVSASNVTIAHITVTHAVDHPIHVFPPDGTTDIKGTLVYGVRFIDEGEQFLKVNSNGAKTAWADEGRVECSFFQMTPAGRPHVESLGGTSCYTGGIDCHGGRGWVVRQNRFEDIYCTNGFLAEHAIHFWNGARDTLVENNTVVNCGRAVGFGLVETGTARTYSPDPYPGVGFIGHYDGIIRNNVVYADVPYFDTGFELDQAHGARVYHNTLYSTAAATGFFSSIDTRFANTVVDVRNNLTTRITVRNGAMGTASNNREMVPAGYFKDVTKLDFHLLPAATDAIDKGVVVSGSGLDLDGDAHTLGSAPDLGADEVRP